jgi:hypothetical protein
MLNKLILILLLTTFSLPAQSLFDDALQEDSSSSTALNYELNGYVRGDIYVGPVPEKSGYETKDRYGEAVFKLRLRKGQWGDAYSELRFRNNNDESSTSTFILREAYVNAYTGPFDMRIGQQVVQWGKADGYNPTNVITPINLLIFSPDEDDRRISNILIRSYYNWSEFRLEAIWIPVYEPSVLPFTNVQLPDGIQRGGIFIHLLTVYKWWALIFQLQSGLSDYVENLLTENRIKRRIPGNPFPTGRSSIF